MDSIIFDLDGTVLHSAPGIIQSLTHAVRALGHDFEPFAGMEHLLGPPMTTIVAQLLKPFGDHRVRECVTIYRDHYGDFGLYQSLPYQGITQALDALRADGYALYVATSKRETFAERILAHTGLRDRFERVYGTAADGSLDDKARLLEVLLASLKTRPATVCMVGDKRDDIIAAQRNAIPAIGVLWGYGTLAELQASGAQVLIRTPAQVRAAVVQVCPSEKG